jgi:endonuclease/exonuclease/phosphatase family metal-dependent hydrolase
MHLISKILEDKLFMSLCKFFYMKLLSFGLTLSLIFVFCGAHAKTLDISVMTFNLRVPVDPAPNDWASRRPRVIAMVRTVNPDFLGVQEAVPQVVSDLSQELTQYFSIGRGREADGGGEGTQIFYRKDRWRLNKLDQGTLQLSPTPDIPGSNAWGMQWPRIFTWALFHEKKSGEAVYVFNTHFPLKPQERDLTVQLLAKYISARKQQKIPVILTGDFNACEGEASISHLLGQGASPIAMQDTYRLLHPDSKLTSFHGFGKENDRCKIDYIFTLGKVGVLQADIIQNLEGEGFASDHYAVTAKIQIGK